MTCINCHPSFSWLHSVFAWMLINTSPVSSFPPGGAVGLFSIKVHLFKRVCDIQHIYGHAVSLQYHCHQLNSRTVQRYGTQFSGHPVTKETSRVIEYHYFFDLQLLGWVVCTQFMQSVMKKLLTGSVCQLFAPGLACLLGGVCGISLFLP